MSAELATTDIRSSELGGIPRRCTSKAIHVKHETRKHGTRVRQESERAWQICTYGCMRTIHITQYILTLFLMDSLAREWRIIKEISSKVIECVCEGQDAAMTTWGRLQNETQDQEGSHAPRRQKNTVERSRSPLDRVKLAERERLGKKRKK